MNNSNKKVVEIWTDGGCIKNPGEGSIGVVMKYQGKEKEINGYVPLTTNNQMELLAVIIALSSLKRKCDINLYTDSKYLKEGITNWINNWKVNGWKSASKQPVKNKKLWQKLDELVSFHKINFFWVKGHSGNPNNERADYLCSLAIKNKKTLLEEYLYLLNEDS